MSTETSDRVYLTYEDAVAMLPDGERIHTFRDGYGALIGAYWGREDIIEAIRDGKPELAGDLCTRMGHGLVVWTGDRPLYVEVRKP